MKLHITLLFLIDSFALASCPEDNKNPIADNEPFEITSETEYAVYRALIEQIYVIGSDKMPLVAGGTKLMVIESETFLNYGFPLNEIDKASREFKAAVLPYTYNSLLHQNQLAQTMDCKKLALSVSCVLFDHEDINELFTEDDEHPKDLWDNWDRFYEEYPGSYYGLVQFSRIGFDTDGNQAIVYVENRFYDLAAAGYYALLARKADTWHLHTIGRLWVS